MTRKEAHAETIKMLRQAADLIDQAHAQAKDALTVDSIATRVDSNSGGRWIGLTEFSGIAERLHHEAEIATCEDCNLVISACACSWSNSEVD